jgi:hypothetical protein
MGRIFLPGGELLPVFVTSDLQAARANFATPAKANLVYDNGTTLPMVRGGAFILAGVHYHVVCAAAGVGFSLNHVFNGTTTVLFNCVSQAEGVLSRSTQLWRPLAGPIVATGPTAAVQGGRLTLTLNGAPGVGSFLEVELWHHFDARYNARYTVKSPVNGDMTLSTI